MTDMERWAKERVIESARENYGTEPRSFLVWCQGGPANDWTYETLIEPEPIIHVMPDPFNAGRFIRVTGDWPEATAYKREASVEQFAFERIFYPAEP